MNGMLPDAALPPAVELLDLGQIGYRAAWDLQQELLDAVISRKLLNRQRGKEGLPPFPQCSYFLWCEHPHVYTLGRNGEASNLLLDEAGLVEKNAEFFRINRGGDITYHGFGQLVGYPIFDLDEFFTDIGRYIRYLEEGVIRTLSEYGIASGRIAGLSGVWLDPELPTARKICAIGVHLSRWVTMHGFAFNINTRLDYFSHIVPCGITDKGVTSLEKELGRKVDLNEVKEKLFYHFEVLFGFQRISQAT
jgi:lipoyl(octanoyl) transferase